MLYPEGAKDVKLGEVVAIIVDSKDDVAKFKDFSGSTKAEEKRSCPGKMERPSSAPEPSFAGAGPSATPAPKKIEVKVEPAPKKEVPTQPAKPTVVQETSKTSLDPTLYEDVPLTNIRKVIADRLSFSKKNIPHYYVTVSVNVDNLLKLRAKLNSVAKTKISVNDMVIKAASLACINVPATNSSWLGETIRSFKEVNMCVAVQTDFGLMAPTLFSTHVKGLEEIAAEVKDIAARARENKLKPEELSGGTFTISNLGMFGVHNFSAIVNPPQACILAVSAAEKVIIPDGEKGFKQANLMNVTLSSDHRVVDGAVAAQWGQEFRRFIENPEYMII